MMKTIPSKREDFEKLTGFDYIKGKLDPKTPMGQKYFKHIQPMVFEHIIQHLEDTERILAVISNNPDIVEELLHDLECIVDISHTISRLHNKELLDEIELFELKNFLLVSQKIREKISFIKTDKLVNFTIPDLIAIIDILDPEGLRLPTFYIYEAYDERLKEIRKKKRILSQIENTNSTSQESNLREEEILSLINEEKRIEIEVLENISLKLWESRNTLDEAFEKVKYLDIILAKAKLASELNLSKPAFNEDNSIKIVGMFNPYLKSELEMKGKSYQSIDVILTTGVTLIVGANMSGKSVVLRTVALINYMAYLGFYVPAQSASIAKIDAIALITEDTQRSLSGLSSFASEIKLIDETYQLALKSNVLALIDEPARTTNPYEGAAIVNALVECFNKTKNITVIVTHFDNIECKNRYRVKGLKEDISTDNSHNTNYYSDIQNLIDYQLVPDDSRIVPKEALRVMELLNIDGEIISEAKKRVEKIP